MLNVMFEQDSMANQVHLTHPGLQAIQSQDLVDPLWIHAFRYWQACIQMHPSEPRSASALVTLEDMVSFVPGIENNVALDMFAEPQLAVSKMHFLFG